ncbi:HNH endonuclease signature motif containing protein [Peribacillus simplex]|uniref:HNH endonuclease n=1 Tax=Peribacillus simplex TaxID=1478 RepID=UPI002E231928|nr:HNH endonuclease signature motif containing protein [Peribacillus simplex]
MRRKELMPDKDGMVLIVSGEQCKGKFRSRVPYQKAWKHVKEGSAIIKDKNTVIKLYSKCQVRKMVLHRDKHICHYCGEHGNTVDHKVPLSHGGYTTPANLVCSCLKCNQMKGVKTYWQFKKELAI